MPVHVVQRGHDRQPVFLSDDHYRLYLSNLSRFKEELSIQVLAYCLMTNHVHLVLLPPKKAMAISRLMKVLAARQTRYFNRVQSRTGTLWEGRFKSSCIEASSYLLACLRYVDLNPVRAGMVTHPSDYRWSSYRGRIGLKTDAILDDHEELIGLGANPDARTRAYQMIVESRDVAGEDFIRSSTHRNQVIGSSRFCENLGTRVGTEIHNRGPGRPRRG